jgi:fructose-1,6-bisphosphatase I
VVSEEVDDFVSFDEEFVINRSMLLKPLDGSSNIDVNISIGTIFGIYRRKTKVNFPVTERIFYRRGEYLPAGI